MRPSSRDAQRLLAASFLFSFNFNLLLPIAPIYADGLTSTSAAGLINAVVLGMTVTLQWLSPALLRRFSKKQLFLAAHLLLGVPGLAHATPHLSESLTVVFGASALRGAGFGLATVVSAGLLLEQVRSRDRGRALGSYGLATALPAIVAPSAGLVLLERVGRPWPVVLAVLVCLLAFSLIQAVSGRAPAGRPVNDDAALPLAVLSVLLRDPALRSLSLAMMLVSIAWIGTMTFIPMVLPGPGWESAATFLLVSGAFIALGRWLAGWVVGRGVSLVGRFPWLVACLTVGLGLLVARGLPGSVVVSAAAYGLGLGLIQTALFIEMVEHNPFGHSAASALWNTSIDLGGVLGTVLLSLLITGLGAGAILWAMPLLALASIPIAAARGTATVPSARLPR